MERRHFIFTSVSALPLLGTAAVFAMDELVQEKPPPIPIDIVKQFVAAGHNDLPKVRRMLQEYPGVLNASSDLGGGDHETALEGAGHVGDREIAGYLIGKGARPNIFVLAMLGHTNVVSSMLKAYPALLRSKGPHGFTLLHHAERGGEQGMELVELLKDMGLTERKLDLP